MPRNFVNRLICLCTVFALLAAVFEEASAQQRSMFGNRGPLNQPGAGFGGPGMGMGGMGGGFGAPGMGGMGMGGMGMGGMGMGGMGMGGPGMGGMGGAQQFGQFSGAVGQGFTGRSDNVGRFVGERMAGQQGMQAGRAGMQGMGMQAGRAGMQGMGMQAGQAGMQGMQAGPGGLRGQFGTAAGRQPGTANQQGFNQFGNQTGRVRSTPQIRPRQRIAFSYPQPEAPAVASALQTRFERLSDRNGAFGDVTVEIDQDSQVLLRGEVNSEDTRRLIERMARLEPGVRSVRNELTVGGGASE